MYFNLNLLAIMKKRVNLSFVNQHFRFNSWVIRSESEKRHGVSAEYKSNRIGVMDSQHYMPLNNMKM